MSYCAGQLRRFDRDRYLTCLLAPADRRVDLFALYAFNLEVAKTAELVSEAELGRIRLQWWRDALRGIAAGEATSHQVLGPLGDAIRRRGLAAAHFERLLAAREVDLEAEAPASLAALLDYAEGTSASLVLLALQVLGVDGPGVGPGVETAGRHVGIAWALTGLLRAVRFHAGQRRLYLPRDMIAEEGLDPDALFALRPSPALNRIAARIALAAETHLAQARARRAEVPRRAFPALILGRLAGHDLKTLRKAGYDPFHPRVLARDSGRAWRLAWARLRGRY